MCVPRIRATKRLCRCVYALQAASSPVAGLQHPGFDESKDGEPVTTKKTPSARIQVG